MHTDTGVVVVAGIQFLLLIGDKGSLSSRRAYTFLAAQVVPVMSPDTRTPFA
jgi:hypothetical protein